MMRLLILLSCLLSIALSTTIPTTPLTTSFSLATTPSGRTSQLLGINSGHNYDPSWLTWTSHLGVTAMRVFGLAGTPGYGANTTLQSWVVGGPSLLPQGTWGASLSGSPVTNLASWQAAVSQLRSPAGHSPSSSGTWSNPPRWAAFDIMLNSTNTSAPAPDGLSMQGVVQGLQSIGVEPLLMFWMGCGTYQFSTMDSSQPAYWAERWELYKHQYIGARWAFVHGVRRLEFYNEPDLNSQCITAWSWLEYYTIQSQAIQNAFADLNADVVSGATSCPVAACPFQPVITASAFAQASFGIGGTPVPSLSTLQVSEASTTQYGATGANTYYGGFLTNDYYAYMGNETIQNEHSSFPLISVSSTVASVNATAMTSSNQNLNMFSIHS